MRAYYERENALQPALEQRKTNLAVDGLQALLPKVDRSRLRNPDDAEVLTHIILTLAEGCTRGREELTAKGMQDILPLFRAMLRSLKEHYNRPDDCKEGTCDATDANPVGTV